MLDEILSSAPDRQIRDYLRLFIKGLPNPVIFPLTQKDIGDFKERVLKPIAQIPASSSPFYWLSTMNGKEVLVSLPDTEYIDFLIEVEKPITMMLKASQREGKQLEKEDKNDGTVDLYFRGRPEPISIQINNSKELKEIFIMLAGKRRSTKVTQLPAFAQFSDNKGQLVVFRPQRLLLLVAHRGSVQMTTESEYEKLFNL